MPSVISAILISLRHELDARVVAGARPRVAGGVARGIRHGAEPLIHQVGVARVGGVIAAGAAGHGVLHIHGARLAVPGNAMD